MGDVLDEGAHKCYGDGVGLRGEVDHRGDSYLSGVRVKPLDEFDHQLLYG